MMLGEKKPVINGGYRTSCVGSSLRFVTTINEHGAIFVLWW
jgi:hypothetical protein